MWNVTQLEHFEAELIGPKDIADYPHGAKYNVKLYFVDTDETDIRSVAIQFQGRTMDGTIQDLSVANCKTKVILREFHGINVDSKLIFDAQYVDGQPPIKLAAIEIVRGDQLENVSSTEPKP